jgi:hypothetical protein
MLTIRWTASVLVCPRFKIPESMIQVDIGCDQVFCHPRKVVVLIQELALVLAQVSIRLSELPLPSIHITLALTVFHKAIVLVHQLDRIVQNCQKGVNHS